LTFGRIRSMLNHMVEHLGTDARTRQASDTS
jgi:hypothetical protein